VKKVGNFLGHRELTPPKGSHLQMPLAPFLLDLVVVASHIIGVAIRTRVHCMSCDPL
jgi:hypothetical protein